MGYGFLRGTGDLGFDFGISNVHNGCYGLLGIIRTCVSRVYSAWYWRPNLNPFGATLSSRRRISKTISVACLVISN